MIAGVPVLGGGYYYYIQTGPKAAQPGKKLPTPAEHKDDSDAQNKGKSANSTFKGGDQGFVDLMLESVEEISHNTKKLRFALPNKDDVSGLHIACMSAWGGWKYYWIDLNCSRTSYQIQGT